MFLENATVKSVTQIGTNIYLLNLISENIASQAKPGQFVNIKVSNSNFPLLRRPFSICNIQGNIFTVMFVTIGSGTSSLQSKCEGDSLDVMGPLGNGFSIDGEYEEAVILAGGIGAAPFPFLISELKAKGKSISCFTGARTKTDVIDYMMPNVFSASDDGSLGFHGNVVELFDSKLHLFEKKKIKVFACGPNAMLKSLQQYCLEKSIDGEISTESSMACGFGLCQGCPIESRKDSTKYDLICKDGPVFNMKDVTLP